MRIDIERIGKSSKGFIKWTFKGTFILDSVIQESKTKYEGESMILVHSLK